MSADRDVLVAARGLTARRGHRVVLEACDISLRRGERVAVYGPNGAGKSTLLQALAGLIPAAGRVCFQGQELGREMPLLDYHRRTAAVFQEPLLLRGTVRDNVRLGLDLRGKAAGPQAEVDAWLDRLRIAHLADRPVGALSGGEAQRTSLARALVLEPDLLFLDEPFSALDAPTRRRLTDEVADVLSERQVATLLVTHDIAEAAALCERCVILDQGRMLQDDTMEGVLQRPASARVAEITGLPNLLQGEVVDAGPEGVGIVWKGLKLTAQARAQCATGHTHFVIHQELMQWAVPASGRVNTVHGIVERVRRSGLASVASVRVGSGGVLQVPVGVGHALQVGAAVAVSFAPQAIWVVPGAGCGMHNGPR